MQALLACLKRNKILVASFFFMILSLHMISLSTRKPSQKDFLRIGFQEALYPFQQALHGFVSGVRAIFRQYVLLYGAQQELDRVRVRLERAEQENLRLREAVSSSKRLAEIIHLQEGLGSEGTPAQVIGRDAGNLFRSLVINRGQRHQISPGMVIVTPGGVVGHIFSVGIDSSRVLLINDPHSGLDGIVQRNRVRGIVQGSLETGCIMKYVPRDADIRVGDEVITAGTDGLFPKGLAVGTVSRVVRRSHGMFHGVEIRPRVDFFALEEVLILSAPKAG
jgi:rod shape-determining protein MreC